MPRYFNIDRYGKQNYGLISIYIFVFDTNTIWNSLPEDIRASPTIASFRTKLKTYLYATAYPA